ncbi:hypothetical protein ABZ915_07750 [Streptomyces sp. NPDC046915]
MSLGLLFVLGDPLLMAEAAQASVPSWGWTIGAWFMPVVNCR